MPSQQCAIPEPPQSGQGYSDPTSEFLINISSSVRRNGRSLIFPKPWHVSHRMPCSSYALDSNQMDSGNDIPRTIVLLAQLTLSSGSVSGIIVRAMVISQSHRPSESPSPILSQMEELGCCAELDEYPGHQKRYDAQRRGIWVSFVTLKMMFHDRTKNEKILCTTAAFRPGAVMHMKRVA